MNRLIWISALAGLAAVSCDHDSSTGPGKKDWKCVLTAANPEFSNTLGCKDDYTALASEPMRTTIAGATSVKVIVDQADQNKLYFQNSRTYEVHWDFASTHLSGNGLPVVPVLSQFNKTEYYTPDRRFILGTLLYYEGPKVWAFELSSYDNASADMIALAYGKIKESTYFGDSLKFHPTSVAIENEAKKLPASVKLVTTEELYVGIDFVPLNTGTSMGRLVFTTAKNLEKEYVGFRDIVVLDAVPNDISVVSGIITQEFQTPLSHINVLSRNRGTPNMSLRGAHTDSALRALSGKWVKLAVTSSEYSVTEVTFAEAEAWWESNRPAAVGVPNMDTVQRELMDVEKILDINGAGSLSAALKKAIPAFGGKTSHFAGFPHMDSTQLRYPKAFGIPVYYYKQFMAQNGLDKRLDSLLNDSAFKADPATRDKALKALRDAIIAGKVDSGFVKDLNAKLDQSFPGIDRIRFRSSTNAEDLDGFTGAGLYDSKTGSRTDPSDPLLRAVRQVWASVWFFRAFEERSYRNIDHRAVGMALLCHSAFGEELANGVAITANPFDPKRLEPGFYINVQVGSAPVVSPDAGVLADEFLYHYDMPGQPIVFRARSTEIPKGTTVLTAAQVNSLGKALKEIHRFYQAAYGTDPSKWYAMDTEFKLDELPNEPGSPPTIVMKQCRPYPGNF